MQASSRANDTLAPRMQRRSGFTIAELLVSLGIVSLLLALALPSISRAREAARRTECSNHLHQIGAAAHKHCATTCLFPFVASSPARAMGREDARFQLAAAPHVALMASLDPTVFRRIDVTDRWLTELSHPLTSPSAANTAVLQTNVPVLRCPSDRDQVGANNYRGNAGIGPYPFTKRSGCRDERNGQGAFHYEKELSPSDFTDGLSNTMLFAEKVIGDFDESRFSPFRDRFTWSSDVFRCSPDDAVAACGSFVPEGNAHCAYGGWTWLLGGLNSTLYNHLLTPNSPVPDCSKGDTHFAGGGAGVYTARSLHPGGVNGVLADGAVRFLAESIDGAAWRALGTRNGAEPPLGL